MRKLAFIMAILGCQLSLAAPDEEVVKAMLSKTAGISAAEIRKYYDACDSGETWSMKICASYLWTEQDLRLNRIYKQVREKAREENFEKSLVASQRAWLAYLEANCKLQADVFNGEGTGWGIVFLGCKADLTRDRVSALTEYIKEN